MKKILLAIGLSLILLQIHAQKKTDFMLVGHRGARGIMPENTIEGMTKALELGATALEMEVVISGDRQVVVSQEPYFNFEYSLTPAGKSITLKDQKKYNIYKMTYEEIRKFDVGSKLHPRFPGQQKFKVAKPLLKDLLSSVEAFVKEHKLKKPEYIIETKLIRKGDGEFQPDSATFIELVMDVVKQQKLEKRVIIQSYDMRTLRYLHQKYPKMKTCLAMDEKIDFEDNVKELGFLPTVYSPYAVLVGKGLVDKCKARGVKLLPWTVNSVKDLMYFKNLGVDGIVTDYPNIIGQVK